MSIEIIPSILSADFARLVDDVEAVRAAGVTKVQVDVMDGAFVPNITVGLPVVEALARATDVALDVHLMIVEPDRWVEPFVDAGASVVTVHAEAAQHLHRTVSRVRERGALAGVALNPGSPLCLLEEVLSEVDVALLMTVNPGFGGQRFIRSVIPKIQSLSRLLDRRGLGVAIQVDGGIALGTAGLVAAAGARQLVAGSSVFGKGRDPAASVTALRLEAEEALTAPPGARDGT